MKKGSRRFKVINKTLIVFLALAILPMTLAVAVPELSGEAAFSEEGLDEAVDTGGEDFTLPDGLDELDDLDAGDDALEPEKLLPLEENSEELLLLGESPIELMAPTTHVITDWVDVQPAINSAASGDTIDLSGLSSPAVQYTLTIPANINLKIIGNSEETFEYVAFVCGGTNKLTIQNLSLASDDGQALSTLHFTGKGNELVLAGMSAITSGQLSTTTDYGAAVGVPDSVELTISGSGELVVFGGSGGAGIGGGYSDPGGNIIINSGCINATGDGGAGIGGGNSGSGGSIIINGGDIAASGHYGAGIGGGLYGSGGSITINGGTILAKSSGFSAGIGGGDSGSSGNITINGGEITAYGWYTGAAIGAGFFALHDSITITGGVVNAYSRGDGAAIGSGSCGYQYPNSAECNITITGGAVTADASWLGGTLSAGIGGGAGCSGGVIKIDGSTVIATGSYGGAAIGGGHGGNGGIITIDSGTVVAYSGGVVYGFGRRSAGIGGGEGGSGGSITINGGAVTTTGSGIGAGIGGGNGADGGEITINGGDVTAYGGPENSAGIGGGSAGSGGTITINGGTITASGDWGAGIGSGFPGAECSITINSGNITASSFCGAGIGSSHSGGALSDSGHTITINGGNIIASSSCEGAGIGSGGNRYGGTIIINGGSVTANGGDAGDSMFAGAGIGGGGCEHLTTVSSGIITIGSAATVIASGGIGPGGCPVADIGRGGCNYTWPSSPGIESNTLKPVAQSVFAGTTATFSSSVTATGMLLPTDPAYAPVPTYQWQVSTDNGLTFADVTSGTGTQSTSYTPTAAIPAMDGNLYRCVATATGNGLETDVITYYSSPAKLTVLQQTYPVIEHFGTWSGTGDSRLGIIDGPYGNFLQLKLNGVIVSPANYSVVSGSTIITLHEAYLKTLANGSYTFTAEFSNGHADLNLFVDVASNPNNPSKIPATGDRTGLLAIGSTLAFLLSAMLLATYARRQKGLQV
jgi:hypothetical protein